VFNNEAEAFVDPDIGPQINNPTVIGRGLRVLQFSSK